MFCLEVIPKTIARILKNAIGRIDISSRYIFISIARKVKRKKPEETHRQKIRKKLEKLVTIS